MRQLNQISFTEVKEIPGRNQGPYKGYLEDALKEFMGMNVKFVEVNNYPNKNFRLAAKTLHECIKRSGYPMKAYGREGKVYLERTDI